MKLAFAAAKADWDTLDVDYQEMKSDRTKYPFGQCPRYA
jgi:hypothetical protein